MGWLLAIVAVMVLAGPGTGTSLLRSLARYQSGAIVADDLVKLREVGYKRATELGFTNATNAKVVLERLMGEVKPAMAPTPIIVQLGTAPLEWGVVLDQASRQTWGDLRRIIDEEMKLRGML